MSYLIFIIRSSLSDFARNKFRTFLTSVGIMIGIFSVVLLISLGLGLQAYISDQFKSLGANLIMVTPGKLFQGGLSSGSSFMNSGFFDSRDVTSIKRVENMALAVPIFVKFTKVQGTEDTKLIEMLASSSEIFPLMNFKVQAGRLFEKADADKGSKVMVLGTNPAKTLFGSKENAIGKIAKMEGLGYKVIGVLESKGGASVGPSLDDHVFIPMKAADSFNQGKKYWAIYGKAYDETKIDRTKEEIKKVLLKRYHDDDFSVNDERELLNTFDSIFNMINMVLVAIAAISLVVGGIGVMNIMFVSVVERVKEIGVRRAFGARKIDILLFFLTESVILSLIGGVMGLVLSFLVVSLIRLYFPAYINLTSVLFAVGVSSFTGIIFGVFPAKRAADLTPVEAIKQE